MASEDRAATELPFADVALERVFERLPTSIAVFDPQGKLTLANPVLERLLGQNRVDLAGQHLASLLHADDRDAGSRAFDFFLRDGRDRQLEARLAGSDPGLWCLISLGWIRDDAGAPTAIIASFQDTTERRQANERLRASAERYRLLVERANEVIFNIDLQGKFTFVNPTASRLMQYPRERLLGMHFLELVDPPHRAEVEEFYAQQVRQRVPSTYYEFPGRAQDGSLVWLGQSVQLNLDGERIASVQAVARDITLRKRAEEALHASEERLRAVVSNAPVILWASDLDGRFTLCEGQGLTGLGITLGDLPGRLVREVFPDPEIDSYLQRALAGDTLQVELSVAGQTFDSWYTPLRDERDAVTGVIGVAVDITAQRLLQTRLHQVDKMEAVGLLAGGVAHDFNNRLTAILGYAELLVSDLDEGDRRRADAKEIVKAGKRAAAVTQQLLAFGRRQPSHPRVVDLSGVIGRVEQLLRRSVRADIDVDLNLREGLEPVRVDPVQIEHALMNLVLNARDAMPSGGRLTITTSCVDQREVVTDLTMPPGRYATIEVTDTGHGMDGDTRAHLFEPFYTTKSLGKGSGLGLASVYGVVKQCGGYIFVTSEPDRGATFRLFFPTVDEPLGDDTAEIPVMEAVGGNETILVVEDDDTVRALARQVLTDGGYEVLVASRAAEALAVAEGHAGGIDLLFTDIVMPGMKGTELADRFTERWPRTRVVFTTAYTDDETLRRHPVYRPHLVEKPFVPNDLLRTVRAALDATVTARGPAAG